MPKVFNFLSKYSMVFNCIFNGTLVVVYCITGHSILMAYHAGLALLPLWLWMYFTKNKIRRLKCAIDILGSAKYIVFIYNNHKEYRDISCDALNIIKASSELLDVVEEDRLQQEAINEVNNILEL